MSEVRSNSPPLTPQQHAALTVKDASVALSAGAGCGKTKVLTERFLKELDQGSLGGLVALTFTEKAARELRERVRAACRRKLDAGDDPTRWRAVLRGLEAAPIGTFHGFCNRLLHRAPIEAGVAPGFAVLEESVAPTLRDAALGRCFRGWLAEQDPNLVGLAVDFGLPFVREALAELISGRTRGDFRTWADREAIEVLDAWRVRWLNEVRPMILANLVEGARGCLNLLRVHRCSHAGMTSRQAFLLTHVELLPTDPDPEGLLDRIREEARVQGGGKKTDWPSVEVYEAVRSGLEALRKSIDATKKSLTWDEAASLLAAEHGRRLARLAADALAAYDAEKRAAGMLDFDDLLVKTRDLLRDRPETVDLAGALLVDEFQDTDPIQGEILEHLAGPGLGAGSLFLVGDPKQSIYRFRGAQPRIFQEFRARFPADGQRVLTENFRSVPGIIHFVNALFAETFPDPGEALRPAVAAPDPDGSPAVTFLWADEPLPPNAPPRSAHGRRQVEARWIARHLAGRLEAGWPVRDQESGTIRMAHPGDIALLFRALTDVGPYESALVAEGLDYHVVGGSAYFTQPEVIDLINLLSVLEDPTDSLALAGTLRSPFCCVSDDALYWLATSGAADLVQNFEQSGRIEHLPIADRLTVERAHALLSGWRGQKDRLPIAALLDRALEASGYEAALLGEFLGPRRRANVRKLVRLARRFDRQGGLTLADFVARLRADQKRPPREEQAATTEEEGTSVRLMSIHQAKGLEFPIVVLPDLDRKPPGERSGVAFHADLGPLLRPPSGDDPDGEAGMSLGWSIYRRLEDREEADEALRLFYVATTRARDSLILTSGSAPEAKPTSQAMALLARRFDRRSGDLLGPLPEDWARPEVRLAATPPEAPDRVPIADRSRPRIAAILDAIESAGPAIEPERTSPLASRPRFVDLDPSRDLAPGLARVDRLIRSVLEDSKGFRPGGLAAAVARAGRWQAPAASRRVRALAVERLAGWIAGPLARGLATASEVVRAVPWVVSWPPGSDDPVVFNGQVDLGFRDDRGVWNLIFLAVAEVPEAPEDLRLLLSGWAAEDLGLGPVARGWRVRLGPGGGIQGQDHFDERTIEENVRKYLCML